jgi:hypothetical protein
MPKVKNRIGMRFGRFTIVKLIMVKPLTYECLCDCGTNHVKEDTTKP